MTTYHAWSNIRYDVERDADDKKVITKVLTIPVGEEVTAEKLNLNEKQFNELIKEGAVRDRPFPKNLMSTTRSPVQLLQDEHAKAGAALDAGLVEELMPLQVPVPTETPELGADEKNDIPPNPGPPSSANVTVNPPTTT